MSLALDNAPRTEEPDSALRKVGEDWVLEEEGGSFGSHLDDLRRALFVAVLLPIGLVIAIWPFWAEVWDFLAYYAFPEHRGQLTRLGPIDTFSLSIKISVYSAIALALPWILASLWWFIAPGLYPHERRFGRIALPLTIVLFYVGMEFALFAVIPSAFGFLMSFGQDVIPHSVFGLSETSDLVFAFLIGMGFCFELPIIVAPAVRFGVLKTEWVTKHRRVLIFISAILGAILTPTGDPVTMSLVGVPIYLLIEGGVLLGRIWRKQAEASARRRGDGNLVEAFRDGLGEDGVLAESSAAGFAESVSRFARDFGQGMRESKDAVTSLLDGDEGGEDENDNDNEGDAGPPVTDPAPTLPPPPKGGPSATYVSDAPNAEEAALAEDASGNLGDSPVAANQTAGQPATTHQEAAPTASRSLPTGSLPSAPQEAGLGETAEKPAHSSGKPPTPDQATTLPPTVTPSKPNSPAAPVASPRAPLRATEAHVEWVMSDLAKDGPVPQLPKELRRRIDHYIRLRLDDMMGDLKAAAPETTNPEEPNHDQDRA